MIGHMIFKKSLDSEDKLGLKVIGGQVLSNGRLGAIVEKVKQGSIADQEGHIKPGMFRPISAIIMYAFQNEIRLRSAQLFLSLHNPLSISYPLQPHNHPTQMSVCGVCECLMRFMYRKRRRESSSSRRFVFVMMNHFILGDEVIEWNGQSLNGRSAQEVHDIIADSKHDLQVELIVSRVIAASRRAAQASWRQSHSPTRLHHAGTLKRRQCAHTLLIVFVFLLLFIIIIIIIRFVITGVVFLLLSFFVSFLFHTYIIFNLYFMECVRY